MDQTDNPRSKECAEKIKAILKEYDCVLKAIPRLVEDRFGTFSIAADIAIVSKE